MLMACEAGRTTNMRGRAPRGPATNRLRAVGAALQPPEGLELDYDQNLRPEPYEIPASCAAAAPKQLLTDLEVQEFLVRGYHVVEADFRGQPVHSAIVDKLGTVIERMENPGNVRDLCCSHRCRYTDLFFILAGNNVLATCPDIQHVFDHPAVRGAVESLVGPEAFLHPHSHCHNHQPGAGDQTWHKDEYNYDCNMRSPQPRWIFALYYPQDVSRDMGEPRGHCCRAAPRTCSPRPECLYLRCVQARRASCRGITMSTRSAPPSTQRPWSRSTLSYAVRARSP